MKDNRTMGQSDNRKDDEMPSDKEMLDWLSGLTCVSYEPHFQPMISERTAEEKRTDGYNGNIDFFSVETQHLDDFKSLRDVAAWGIRKGIKPGDSEF